MAGGNARAEWSSPACWLDEAAVCKDADRKIENACKHVFGSEYCGNESLTNYRWFHETFIVAGMCQTVTRSYKILAKCLNATIVSDSLWLCPLRLQCSLLVYSRLTRGRRIVCLLLPN